MLPRHSKGTYRGNELKRNSSVNTRRQSSRVFEPIWTNAGFKSGIGVRELISIFSPFFLHFFFFFNYKKKA